MPRHNLDLNPSRHSPKAISRREWYLLQGLQGLCDFTRKCPTMLMVYGETQLAKKVAGGG